MSIWEHIWATDKFYMEISCTAWLFCMKVSVSPEVGDKPRTAVLWLVSGKKKWSDAGSYVAENTSCWKKELIL